MLRFQIRSHGSKVKIQMVLNIIQTKDFVDPSFEHLNNELGIILDLQKLGDSNLKGKECQGKRDS